jgi:UDP-N-acetylglucosamine:LPS N-acetylglucosamine transferase
MGGGFGIIPVSNEFLSKLDSLEDINIKILTGTNKRLEKNIKNNFKHIEVLGFTPNIQEYMMNADLLITKSGGITIFEAIETETPLCLFEPFLVQEEENAEFIKKHKMGIIVKGEKSKDVKKILDLLNNEEELNEIKRNMQEFKKTLTNPYTKKFYKG